MAERQLGTVLEHLRALAGSPPARDVPDGRLLADFLARGDQAAFGVLVRRHGPLVLSVCRRVLHHEQDAEDAFQATFLVLVRRAASVRKGKSLASWLHGVAYRTAMRAKRAAARRRVHERRGRTMPQRDASAELGWQEVQAALDAEIQRLPEKYRAPFVLCQLEGHSRAEAAGALGLKEGTVSSRLARAREQLRQRLGRRGVSLSAVLGVAALVDNSARAAVPALLSNAAVRAASAYAAGQAVAAGVIPAHVSALAEGVSRALSVAKWKIAAVVLLAVGMAGGAGVLAHQAVVKQAGGKQPGSPAPVAADQAKADGEKQARTDRYGDLLPEGAKARLGTVRFHGLGFSSLAYTPDGKLLVSGGSDGARVWDAATGKEVRRLPADQCRDPYGPVALSPDGKLVAVGGYDQEGMGGAVYKLATGRRLYRFGRPGHSTEAYFSPDGSTLAVSYSVDDPSIGLHDAGTGARLRSLVGHEQRKDLIIQQVRVVFSPGGKVLVSGGADGTIRFWNVATGQELRRLTVAPHYLNHLALSPDGSWLAAVDLTKTGERGGRTFWDHRIQLWKVDIGEKDVAVEKKVRRLVVPAMPNKEGRQFEPASLAFTPDGQALVIGGWDKTLRVMALATGKERRRFAAYGTSLAIAPDGKSVAVVAGPGPIRICDLASGRDLVPTGGHGDMLSAVALSPDDRTAVTASRDGTIRLWDARTGRELRQLASGQPHLRRRLLYSPDGQTLFVAGGDQTIGVWNPATGQELRPLKRHPSAWDLVALSPDGKTLASEAPGNTLVLVEAATGKELRTLKGPTSTIAGVAFSGDGRKLLAWSFDDHLHWWDAATGQHQRRRCALDFTDGVRAVAFTPDGRLVALGGSARIAVVAVATGREVCRFDHGDGSRDDSMLFLAFSPDGRTLAWGVPRDSIIRLGEVLTGKERHRLAGHRGYVESAVFGHEGKFLVSGATDTTALVWDLGPRLPAAAAPAKSPGEMEMAAWWADLVSEDARRAYGSIQALLAVPRQAVPFLKERLRPIAMPDAKRIAQLIADLDNERFAVRERATQELGELGELAEPALQKALEGRPSLELRRRVEGLMANLRRLVPSPGTRQSMRAIEVLEHIGTPEARDVLKALAQGAPEARQTQEAKAALERLARRAAAGH